MHTIFMPSLGKTLLMGVYGYLILFAPSVRASSAVVPCPDTLSGESFSDLSKTNCYGHAFHACYPRLAVQHPDLSINPGQMRPHQGEAVGLGKRPHVDGKEEVWNATKRDFRRAGMNVTAVGEAVHSDDIPDFMPEGTMCRVAICTANRSPARHKEACFTDRATGAVRCAEVADLPDYHVYVQSRERGTKQPKSWQHRVEDRFKVYILPKGSNPLSEDVLVEGSLVRVDHCSVFDIAKEKVSLASGRER